jgi:hypothetical protein
MLGTLLPKAIPAGGGPGSQRPPTSASYAPLKQQVPIREAADQPDSFDAQRIAAFGSEYRSQTEALALYHRQIEYNVRMLLGQQRSVWDHATGQFYDVSRWLTDDEKAWRQLAVINKEQRWFVLTHARMTENPPILTVLPGPDRTDALLAEVVDTLLKKDWRDAGMESVHDELMMWMVVAGRAHAVTSLDPTRGEWQEWIGEAQVPMVGPDGLPLIGPDGQPMLSPMPVPDVPFGPDGQPRAEMLPDGTVRPTGPAHAERTGGVRVDVYSPLQVRGQWGPQLWHDKAWHGVQRFLTPEQVFELWGVEVEPDLTAAESANMATIERVLYGSGFFGQQMGRVGSSWVSDEVKGPLCTVYERWSRPIPYDERLEGTWAEALMDRPGQPGGRHTVWTPKAVLRDGAREVAWPHVSPIRCFDFVRLPGRPAGMTPLETLHGPQRAYNQSRQQEMEHAALLGNPQMVVDAASGLDANQVTNAPGEIYVANRVPGVPAIDYVQAPPLSSDVYQMTQYAAREIDELGGLQGTEGVAPTKGASGELVKELRFNSDRLLGAAARRAVAEYARMGRDWLALYPLIYTQEEVIAINGEDHMATTLTVMPELFQEGTVNIVPDAESMLPEGRGERQQRAYQLWKEGAFGEPNSPQALDIFFEQSRFPNYSKLSRPGGIDRVTAEQENGSILAGEFEQPVLEWYDHLTHIAVHERFMKSKEFLKQDPIVQQAFAFHRLMHLIELSKAMMGGGGMGPMGGLGQPGTMGQPGGGAPRPPSAGPSGPFADPQSELRGGMALRREDASPDAPPDPRMVGQGGRTGPTQPQG